MFHSPLAPSRGREDGELQNTANTASDFRHTMQSAARVAAPRLVNISRRNSTNSLGSVYVEQEVTVTSRFKSDAEANDLNPIYKTTSSVSNGLRPQSSTSNGHMRSHSRELAWEALSPRPVLSLWRSDHSATTMSPRPAQYESGPLNMDGSDSNRDGMRALAEFLRTKEPPPENFMSIPDDDAGQQKGKAYQLFGRRKKKKNKTLDLIQLPDSAVSAKTRRGSRYIAISIPVEYDYPEKPPLQTLSSPLNSFTAGKPNHPDPVVVPKPTIHQPTKLSPLAEVQEVASPKGENSTAKKHDSRNARSDYMIAMGNGVIGRDTPQQRSYIAVSPDDIIKRDSQFGDNRHSGGTQYSTASLNYEGDSARGICNAIMGSTKRVAHSRDISGVSSAPSATAIKVEIPPRTTRIPVISSSDPQREAWDDHMKQKEVLESAALESAGASNRSSVRDDEDVHSLEREELEDEVDEPMRGRSRERRQPYLRVISSRTASPIDPDQETEYPAGIAVHDFQDDVIVAEVTLPPTPPVEHVQKRELLQSHPKAKGGSMIIANSDDTFAAARESRQERVRARKARDIAALRERSQSTLPPGIQPSRSLKHKNTPLDLHRRRNTVSQVMIVVDIAPYIGFLQRPSSSPPSSPAARHKHRNSSPGTPTPPQSADGSDSNTIRQFESQRSLNPGYSPQSGQSLHSRRQERRTKRNESARKRGKVERQAELEMRVEKLETDNRMLVRALGGIGQSFRELGLLLPGLKAVGGGQLGIGLAGIRGSIEDLDARMDGRMMNEGKDLRSIGTGKEMETDSESEAESETESEMEESEMEENEEESDGQVRDIEPVMRELQASMQEYNGVGRY